MLFGMLKGRLKGKLVGIGKFTCGMLGIVGCTGFGNVGICVGIGGNPVGCGRVGSGCG